jgi:CDI immunity protein
MADEQGNANVYLRKNAMVAVPTVILCREMREGVAYPGTYMDVDPAEAESAIEYSSPDCDLGAALRRALFASRLVTTTDVQRESDFPADLAGKFGLRSKAKLYPGMRSCWVRWKLDEVVFWPSMHKRGGLFVGFPLGYEHLDVAIKFSQADAELGEATRLCLSRCTS